MMTRKVLVVDDEPDVRFILQSLLKTRGLKVESSSTIKECMLKINTYRPDCVILDIDLPDGSGLDAIPKIKDIKPDTEVIINSALGTEENKIKAEKLGSEAFLTKPLDKAELFQVLNV